MTQREGLLREEPRIQRHVSYALQSYVQWGWRGDYQELRQELTQEAWLGLLESLAQGREKRVDNAIRKRLNRWWRREREWLEHVEVRSVDAPGL